MERAALEDCVESFFSDRPKTIACTRVRRGARRGATEASAKAAKETKAHANMAAQGGAVSWLRAAMSERRQTEKEGRRHSTAGQHSTTEVFPDRPTQPLSAKRRR